MTSTIAAIATPPGQGGVGIIRISGSRVADVAHGLLGKLPKPRYAYYAPFLAADHSVLDQGIAIYFPAPHSFTGEDILELHGHGGPVVLDLVLQRILALGVELARPGEFSERAFLNGKLDLTQAEAIADLIAAQSAHAAQSALRSLQGAFAQHIEQLSTMLTELRMYVEAAIDFPEEEIDFLSDARILTTLQHCRQQLSAVEASAQQGALLREGITVVIAGQPNVGKSSLLNCLSGQDSAIVTAIPGTTRDVLRERIQLDGLPLHIIDTAGLRDSDDVVEQEGIRRARLEIDKADCVLWLHDSSQGDEAVVDHTFTDKNVIIVHNKIDLTNHEPAISHTPQNRCVIKLSAKTGQGLDLLRTHLKTTWGYNATGHTFSARRRHLEALTQAKQHLAQAEQQLTHHRAGELLAEELRLAHHALGTITGVCLPDDLLAKIFSSFCIGK